MNIEIANRLVELRKKHGLSQEQLAEKVGVSRQAVSKWERSEASPDTDNIIILARIYGISLDQLLSTDDEIPPPRMEKDALEGNNRPTGGFIHVDNKESYVNIGASGIFVEDRESGDRVKVGWSGIQVEEKHGDKVDVDFKGVNINGEYYPHGSWWNHSPSKHSTSHKFPYAILCVIGFLLIGFLLSGWYWGWLIFLTIPLYHGLISAIDNRNASIFPYPILVTIIFFLCGFFYYAWHPAWVLFLTIPIYYWITSALSKKSGNIKDG